MRPKKLGAPQRCPNCGMFNKSGLKLPEDCVYCNKEKSKFSFHSIKARFGFHKKV